jgi:nucleotide-binding universal stress UspA family protein
MKRILIPVDGSSKSLAAVRAVVREGAGAIAQIDLVNVQPLFNRRVSRWVARSQRDAWRAERSERALARARTVVEMSGIPCRTHAEAGPVAEVIAAAANRLRSHEIVVGATRRALWGRFLANSASTRLLAVSAIPVRVIPVAPAPLIEALALPAGLGLVALLFLVAD